VLGLCSVVRVQGSGTSADSRKTHFQVVASPAAQERLLAATRLRSFQHRQSRMADSSRWMTALKAIRLLLHRPSQLPLTERIWTSRPHEADLLRSIGRNNDADWPLRCTLPQRLVRVLEETASKRSIELRAGQVALGDCSPRAPTDPYVRTLPHTVHLMMDSPCSSAACPERYPGPCR
jgi:hypothetical protein